MAGGNSRIFPLVDRETPVIDRVRERRSGAGSAKKTGEALGEALLEPDEADKIEKLNQIYEGLNAGLAQAFGVEPSHVDEKAFAMMFDNQSLDPQDMVNEDVIKGITEPDGDEGSQSETDQQNESEPDKDEDDQSESSEGGKFSSGSSED